MPLKRWKKKRRDIYGCGTFTSELSEGICAGAHKSMLWVLHVEGGVGRRLEVWVPNNQVRVPN